MGANQIRTSKQRFRKDGATIGKWEMGWKCKLTGFPFRVFEWNLSIERNGAWSKFLERSFRKLVPIAGGVCRSRCLGSRSCIYTGGVIHGLHGTVTPLRSINILRAVIPQHPQPSPPPTYVHRWIGLYSIPRSSLHYFSAPRRCKRACKTGNVGHVYVGPCVSSGSSHGMHKSEIVARDDTTLSRPGSSSRRVITNSLTWRINRASSSAKIRASIVYGWDRSIDLSLSTLPPILFHGLFVAGEEDGRASVCTRVVHRDVLRFFIDSLRLFAWNIYICINIASLVRGREEWYFDYIIRGTMIIPLSREGIE